MIDEMKGRIVQSGTERARRKESGELTVVGVNSFTETEPSPLAEIAQHGGIVTIDPAVELEHVRAIEAWRAARDEAAFDAALAHLRAVAETTENLVPATIALAKAGGTVGEWAGALREVFGEYRAPTGVGNVAAQPGAEMEAVRERVRAIARETGRPIRLLVGKKRSVWDGIDRPWDGKMVLRDRKMSLPAQNPLTMCRPWQAGLVRFRPKRQVQSGRWSNVSQPCSRARRP